MVLLLVLFFPFWGMVGQLWADHVTVDQARQQAQTFLNSRIASGSGPRHAPGTMPQLLQEQQVSGLYVFNISNDGGFVIVSDDDRTVPILGFGDSGHIDPNNMPDNMRAWLQGYADEIAWAKRHNGGVAVALASTAIPRRVGTHSTANIAPLMSTTWNQGTPYNNLCPEFQTGQRAVTGCVATAMAQAMYYTEKKANNSKTSTTADIPAYISSSYKLSLAKIDAGTDINWGNMINSYANGAGTDAQKLAVAQLMLYCGCSVEMDYGPSSGSNSALVANALKKYFNYASTVQCVSRSYYSFANWTDMIYNELSQGRPVVYGGQSSGGGHEFVCDGYKFENSTDYFHINWGWGGQSDNYFVLSVLNPTDQGIGGSSSSDGFNSGQDAVVGIQKTGGTGTVHSIVSNVNLTINRITLSKSNISNGESITVTINVTNNSEDVYDGELSLVVNNELGEGKMFEIAANATADCSFTFTPAAAGTYIFKCAIPTITGSYSWNDTPSVTLRVDDNTPYDLNASAITPSTAVVGWTSNATGWNLKSRPLAISEMAFGDGDLIGWSYYINNQDYWIITPTITLGGSITFWAGGEGTSGKFRVYVGTGGNSYSPVSQEFEVTSTRREYTVDLSRYNGMSDLAFIIYNAENNSADIDNFTIVEPGSWTTINNVTTNPLTLTGLTPETRYEVQVQAVINDATTDWSDPLFFTTLSATPADVTVQPTYHSATISWTANADSYEVRYGLLPANAVINQPASWLKYDNGIYRTNYGFNLETTTWGVMYPGNLVTNNLLTKIAIYENTYNAADITVNIYSGGDNAPRTLLHTQVVTTERSGFHEITLSSPVEITPGENLWITLTETGDYPVTCCENTEPNNRWIYNGDTWNKAGVTGYGWMIRAYMESKELGIDWTTAPCTDMSYEITGLTAGTDYVVQVRGKYGDNYSPWITKAFTTLKSILLADNATNNSSIIEENDGEKVRVTLAGRTLIKDGAWNTLCLPFDVYLKADGCPLAGATAKTLSNATMTNSTVELTFGDAVDVLEAGVPYIIKWNSGNNLTEDDLVFTDVTIEWSRQDDRTISMADGHVKFIGYYDAFEIDTPANDDIYYMTADNTLKHTGKARTLGACRAYFQFSENIVTSSRQFVLDFGDGVTTTIMDIEHETSNMEQSVYDLQGRHIQPSMSKRSTLNKGLYIRNGKKVVIR